MDDGKPSDGDVYAVNPYWSQSDAIVQADGVTIAIADCGGNYNSTEAKYNLPIPYPGINRIYFYLD